MKLRCLPVWLHCPVATCMLVIDICVPFLDKPWKYIVLDITRPRGMSSVAESM